MPYLFGRILGNPARAMAVGILIGGTAQALCQLPAVLKAGFRFGFIGLGRAFRNPGMKRVFALIGPTIVGMAAYQINILVSTYLATNSGTGSVASLQYSLRLQELVLGVFVVSLGTVLLPDLAGSARAQDWDSYSDSLKKGLGAMLLITIPVAVYSMIVGEDIVTLLFRRREFGLDSVRLTSAVFFWHMSGLAFIAVNRVIAPAFYARGDTKTPTLAGLISVGVNIGLAFFLVGPLKAPGIALALAGASAVNSLVLVIALIRARDSRRFEGPGRVGTLFAQASSFFLAWRPSRFFALRPILNARLAAWNVNLAAGMLLIATFFAFGWSESAFWRYPETRRRGHW